MNYIKHLTGFYNRIAFEKSLNPTHISLYLTIFQCWNLNRFKNPIMINREEIMKNSKIASKATYHKCIKELQRLKYIDYMPSFNPHSGSSIFVHDLSDLTKTIPFFDTQKPKNELVNEPPYIYNNKTLINNIDIGENFKNFNSNDFLEETPKLFFPKKENFDEGVPSSDKIQILSMDEKSCEKKEESNFVISSEVEKPKLEIVKEYFKIQNATEFEAERFYNYYSSIGWLIGGKTEMKDWQASARNWILNTPKFTVNLPTTATKKEPTKLKPNHLNTTTDKDYSEPL